MKNYLELMARIMREGKDRKGRNGYTRSLFAQQLRWDLRAGFPAVTTKELKFPLVVGELLWFLSGSTNNHDLAKCSGKNPGDKTIWSANEADFAKKNEDREPGDLGRMYGKQWREFRSWRDTANDHEPYEKKVINRNVIGAEYNLSPHPGGDDCKLIEVDQIANLVHLLKTDPYSRYLKVTAWNPGDLDAMALPACHGDFQCYVAEGELSLHMVQRSCDLFLGVPFNIASYALLTHMLAQVCGLQVGELVITLNDVHIYHSHFAAVEEQLSREPYQEPQLWLNPCCSTLEEFTLEDVRLVGYRSHPAIKAEMVV